MAKRYLPPGVDPPPKTERLGSPALAAQRRLMGETGRAESAKAERAKTGKRIAAGLEARQRAQRGAAKKNARKRISGKGR